MQFDTEPMSLQAGNSAFTHTPKLKEATFWKVRAKCGMSGSGVDRSFKISIDDWAGW